MKVVIYALIDPTTQEIRYVGKTIDITKRMQRHKRDALRGNTAIKRVAWLRGLSSKGHDPDVEILCEATDKNWQQQEQHFIEKLKAEGHRLTNMTPGGEYGSCGGVESWNYGRRCREETKQKIALKAKQRWAEGVYDFHRLSWEEKYGTEKAERHRQTMKEYNKNRIITEKTRQKISELQSRPIVLVNDDGVVEYEFANARLAGEALGCKRSNINNRRRMGGKVLGKYKVYYKDEYKQTSTG